MSDRLQEFIEIWSAPMTYARKNFTVWSEIPVTDLDRAIAFYNAVCDVNLKLDDTGPNPIAMFKTEDASAVCGHIYFGKPEGDGSGPTVHLAAPGTLEDIIARIWNAGGKVISPPISIPSGRFAYALDQGGNSVGFFELANGRPQETLHAQSRPTFSNCTVPSGWAFGAGGGFGGTAGGF